MVISIPFLVFLAKPSTKPKFYERVTPRRGFELSILKVSLGVSLGVQPRIEKFGKR